MDIGEASQSIDIDKKRLIRSSGNFAAAGKPFMTNPFLASLGRCSVFALTLTCILPAMSQTTCSPKKCLYANPDAPAAERARDLVGRMTLEEKVSQTLNHAVAIPRLDIPTYDWWNEALHGVARNGIATVFPESTGLAATWDAPLVHEAADVISTEARAKNNDALAHGSNTRYSGLTFWSPNINILRDPRWGRGMETFGEDPFLTSTLGVAFVTGLQGNDPHYLKVVATPKHFGVHSGPEPLRHQFNVNPSPYDLEDTYMPAFRSAIVDGRADSIMCAYNAVDGSPACSSDLLLKDHLRNAWHFAGYVVSDCDAVADIARGHHAAADNIHGSALALAAGTDLDCGGAYHSLITAVKTNLVPVADLDEAVVRLFTARFRLGMFDPPNSVPFRRISIANNNTPAHRQLALKAAEESLVLLKNDGTLPLKSTTQRIAVIGPAADNLSVLEGNYNGTSPDPINLLLGMREQFKGAHIEYAQGSVFTTGDTAPIPFTVLRHAGKEGLQAEYFDNTKLDGKPVLVRTDPTIDFDWSRSSPDSSLPIGGFSVRWTGEIVPPAPGEYAFHFRDRGGSAHFFLDGKDLGDGRTVAKLTFTDTQPHTLRIEYTHTADNGIVALEWEPPAAALLARAVQVAQQSDVIVACIGLSPRLEGEESYVVATGFNHGDRTTIALPAIQQALLEKLAATGKPLIVVTTSGSGVALTWAAEHANAMLQAWYPGEAGGQAVAMTLAGDNNPSGRLPMTFYRSDKDLPPFEDYNMQGHTYRYFSKPVLFSFGYGLSYSSFRYSNLHLSSNSVIAGKPLMATADITNTGREDGDEVAELYLTPHSDTVHPLLELKGFTRVALKAGATRQVRFMLDDRQLSLVKADGHRADLAGAYTLSIGGAQPQFAPSKVEASFHITGEYELPE
jgi:beta-glucosidase